MLKIGSQKKRRYKRGEDFNQLPSVHTPTHTGLEEDIKTSKIMEITCVIPWVFRASEGSACLPQNPILGSAALAWKHQLALSVL